MVIKHKYAWMPPANPETGRQVANPMSKRCKTVQNFYFAKMYISNSNDKIPFSLSFVIGVTSFIFCKV